MSSELCTVCARIQFNVVGEVGGVKLLRAPRQGIRGWLYAPEEAEPWGQKEQGWGS